MVDFVGFVIDVVCVKMFLLGLGWFLSGEFFIVLM